MFVGIGVGVGRQRFGADYIKKLVKAYNKRVTDDGGVIEATSCVYNSFVNLGAAKPVFYDFADIQWQLINTEWQLINTTWN